MTDRPNRPTKAKAKPAAQAKPDAGTPEGERIAKVLSRAGVASRREAERMIELGEVAVNGKVINSPALNVTAKDRITVRGEPLAAAEPARLWLYYKPEGLVTSASDEKGRETVFDTLPEDMPRVMSIGRLDLNSEGLLLLTNDGELKRKLELPSTGWLRKYRVRVKGNPTDVDLEPLRKGITIEGERFMPMIVSMDRHQGANAWLTIGLREGRNREIRRAINAIGMIVNRLIRVSYGPFRLGDMEPGDVEEVKGRVLRDQLGHDGSDLPEDAPKGRAPRPGAKPIAAKPGTPRPGAPDRAAKGPTPSGAPKSGGARTFRTAGSMDSSDPTKRAPRTARGSASSQGGGESRGRTPAGPGGSGPRKGPPTPRGGPAKPRRS